MYQEPPARFSAPIIRKKAAHPLTPYERHMTPAAPATLPPAIRVSPKARRPFGAVLSLGAFMPIASCGRGAGHPITYKCDITLIS
jgi:hypothetical protein